MRLEQPPTGAQILKIPNFIYYHTSEGRGSSTWTLGSTHSLNAKSKQWWPDSSRLNKPHPKRRHCFLFLCWYLSPFFNNLTQYLIHWLQQRENVQPKVRGFFFRLTFLSVNDHKHCWRGSDWLVFISAQSDFFKWLIYRIFENKGF